MIRQAVVVSDLHCGCQLGLFPGTSSGFRLDGGGQYLPSDLQRRVWDYWLEFWRDWVPSVTEGEPWALVVNGDAVEGVHHKATSQVTHNMAGQSRIAEECLRVPASMASAVYMVRGTEAHVGQSAEHEEQLGRALGVTPTRDGLYSRWQLVLQLGPYVVDFQHHIASVNSNAYETTALQKEFVIACEEAGRWNRRAPDCIVRSHRHRLAKTEVPTASGSGVVVTTPGWQLKTPFTYRLPGGRQSLPQFGGVLVRAGSTHLYTKHKVWTIDPPTPIIPGGDDE